MKAWLLEGLNGIEHLRLGDVADPRAAANEVVLRGLECVLVPTGTPAGGSRSPAATDRAGC